MNKTEVSNQLQKDLEIISQCDNAIIEHSFQRCFISCSSLKLKTLVLKAIEDNRHQISDFLNKLDNLEELTIQEFPYKNIQLISKKLRLIDIREAENISNLKIPRNQSTIIMERSTVIQRV